MSELNDDYRKMVVEMKIEEAIKADRERICKVIEGWTDGFGWIDMPGVQLIKLIKEDSDA